MSVDDILFTSVVSIVTPTWLLTIAALLVLCIVAGLPVARRIDAPASSPAVSLVASLSAVVIFAGLPMPFTRISIAAFLVVIALANFIPTTKSGGERNLPSAAWLALAGIALVFLFLLTRPDAYMHYDYFHANMRSLDLARSGSVLSDWYAMFDPGGWYLLDQSTSIVLDGLEIVWAGTDTGILSKLYTLMLVCWLLALIARRGSLLATMAAACALILYMLDNAFAFRPHVYVGLILAILAITLAERRRGFAIASAVLVVSLALAKRDGLILAPLAGVIAGLAVVPRSWFRPQWIVAGLAVAAIPVAAGLAVTKIGGVPVGLQLLHSLQQLELMALLQQAPVHYLAVILCLVAAAYFAAGADRRRLLLAPILLIGLTGALILASAILLEGADRFNDGTMIRKLLYFVGPQVLVLLALSIPSDAERRTVKVPYMAFVAAFACTVGILGYQLRDIVQPRTAWGKPAIEAVAYFRDAVPDPALRIGFYAPTQDYLARTPFGDVEAYQFPQMTAYLGRDLRFGESIADLADRDVILLPRNVSWEERDALIEAGDWAYRELEGDYGMLVSLGSAAVDASSVVLKWKDGAPLTRPLLHRQWQDAAKTFSPDLSLAEVPWPSGQVQVMFVWPTDPGTWQEAMEVSFANPGSDYVHRIEFQGHPLGDRTPLTVGLTVDGHTTTADAASYLSHGRYVIPVESSGPFTLSFTADSESISPAWNVPYFAIFGLNLLFYER